MYDPRGDNASSSEVLRVCSTGAFFERDDSKLSLVLAARTSAGAILAFLGAGRGPILRGDATARVDCDQGPLRSTICRRRGGCRGDNSDFALVAKGRAGTPGGEVAACEDIPGAVPIVERRRGGSFGGGNIVDLRETVLRRS